MLRVVSFSTIYTSTRILSMDIMFLRLPGAVRQRLLPEPVTKADVTRPIDVDIVASLMSDYMGKIDMVCFFVLPEMLVQHKREERDIFFTWSEQKSFFQIHWIERRCLVKRCTVTFLVLRELEVEWEGFHYREPPKLCQHCQHVSKLWRVWTANIWKNMNEGIILVKVTVRCNYETSMQMWNNF